MVANLTIQEKLKDLRIEKNLTLEQLAQETGISKSALGAYENDEERDISHRNIITLTKYYGVSADYLLGLTENRKYEDTDIAALHLKDSVIEILKSGRLNNRLLGEMIENESFFNFLLDVEVFVDGHASMPISGINHIVDAVKDQLAVQNGVGEESIELRIFQNAHIHEERYLHGMIAEDMIGIVDQIRKAHSLDRESAPINPLILDLVQAFHDSFDSEDISEEEKLKYFAISLDMDYEKLSDTEKSVLRNIMEQSGHMNILGLKKKERKSQLKKSTRNEKST